MPAHSQSQTGWIVAIETVATAGSVALLHGDELTAEITLPADSRSAKTLAAAIRSLWQNAAKPPIQLVAVAHGPGSFTGLRVGVITAKALAYGWRAQLLGVNTLDAIARQVACERTATALNVVLDAQRQELFIAHYQASRAGCWDRTEPDSIVGTADWLAQLQTEHVAGPPLKKLRDKLPGSVLVAADNTWHPQAATIGQLARARQQSGAADELWTLQPHYLRVSYAEEGKRVER